MQNLEIRTVSRMRQTGAATVEFALVATVFFTILVGIVEMGRVLFFWNTAAEATRLGARVAVVCNLSAAAVVNRMTALFPFLGASDISVSYAPASCTVNNCQTVTVSLNAKAVDTYIPWVPLTMSLPSVTTTLPRESLQNTFNGTTNPVCVP